MSARIALARYRFTRELRRAWTGYLALVLLTGLIGGVAIGSLVTARETSSSYATLLAKANPSDMNVTIDAPNITTRLARLPGVRHVEGVLFSFNAFPMGRHDKVLFPPAYLSGEVAPMASLNGEYFDQDRVSVVAGRRADVNDAGQFMATAAAERALGWHVGQRIEMGFFTNAQVSTSGFGTAAVRPVKERVETLVGTFVFNSQVVEDEIEESMSWLLFPPPAARSLSSGAQYIQYSFQLRRGAAGVTPVERETVAALPPGNTYNFHVTSVVEGEVARTVRPEALALGVFGLMALLGALLTAVQFIARQLRARRADQAALRALGAPRGALVVDALAGPAVALVVGVLLADAVAVALSPLSPIGPVRAVLATGFHVDAGVVAVAGAALLVGTLAAVVVLAYRWSPGRRGSGRAVAGFGSRVARWGASAGLPASAVAGLHFALESGRGRTAAPVRSVLVGVTAAVAMVGATLTFGSGLTTLVSHPELYGWNWNYAVFGSDNVPPPALAVLSRSPLVASWSGVNFANAQINGLTVPILLVQPGASVSPPLLSGHGVGNIHQIVLGAATLAELHKRVGQTVVAGYGDARDYPVYVPPTTMTIVGAATLPAVGNAQTIHTSMGVGAEIDVNIEPPAFKKFIASPYKDLNGPGMVFVRLRPSVGRAQGLALMRQVARAGDRAYATVPNGAAGGASISTVSVQYPAEIVNYRSIGDIPLWLALGFASGIAAAFALTVAASVRRRRRDLALLKTLGFTRRQLGASIAWQATVTIMIGLVVGIPAGTLLGQWLWDLFAREIYAVPRATVPTVSLVLLGTGALVLANVVAFFPSRSAARTRAAIALRAE